MSLDQERAAFRLAHNRWHNGDFDGFMDLLDEDILYIVNVDGLEVPYASSAAGKEDVRQRLEHLLYTFVVDSFELQNLVHEAEYSRSVVIGKYTHKKTGERLHVTVRFHAWVKDGLITRMEERHDAAYVQAFQRFVHHLQIAAEDREG